MIRILTGILVLFTSVAWLNAEPPPPKPKSNSSLTVLEKSPASYIGVRVTVKSNAALQLNSGEEYSELVVENDEKSPVTRLKFRMAPGLASQLSDHPQVKGSPVRLVGVVLGPEEGKGPYVIHLDEVSLLDAKGNVVKTCLLKKDVEPVKSTPDEVKATPNEIKPAPVEGKKAPNEIKPTIEVKKPEPKVESKVAPVPPRVETPEAVAPVTEKAASPSVPAVEKSPGITTEMYAAGGVVVALMAGTGLVLLMPRKRRKVVLNPKKARAVASVTPEPPVEQEPPQVEIQLESPKPEASGIRKKSPEPVSKATAAAAAPEGAPKTVSDRLSRRIR